MATSETRKSLRRRAVLRQVKDTFNVPYALEIVPQEGDAPPYHIIAQTPTGFVLAGFIRRSPQHKVALKFFAPSEKEVPGLLPGTKLLVPEDTGSWQREIDVLRNIDHENLQCMLGYNVLDYDKYYFLRLCPALDRGDKVPFLVSRYIDGEDLECWLRRAPLDLDAILDILSGTLAGLRHLHEVLKVQHFDLRMSNIVVRQEANIPVLLDYGLAKRFDTDSIATRPYTKLGYDPATLPESVGNQLEDLARRGKEDRSVSRRDLATLAFPQLDLCALSLVLGKMLSDFPQVSRALGRRRTRYLELLIRDLSDLTSCRDMTAATLESSLATLRADYLQIGSMDALAPPELADTHIQLPRHAVGIGDLVSDLIETKAFRRLRLCRQLGLLGYVYPGATQTRYAHCLSVLRLCGRFLTALQVDPVFRGYFATREVQQRIVAVALLHDIVHFPFYHYFQEQGLANYDKHAIVDLFCNGRATGDRPSIYEILDGIGLPRDRLHRILFTKRTSDLKDREEQLIKSLFDSAVDLDKLAYLPDDSAYTGVPYGLGVDIEALLRSAVVEDVAAAVDERAARHLYHICFTESALPAAENVVCARYWHFSRVYWHRTNRAIAAMLGHVIDTLYGGPEGRPADYVLETVRMGDERALELLIENYNRRMPQPHAAPIAELSLDRRSIYKCVLECVPANVERPEDARSRMCIDLASLDRDKLLTVRKTLAAKLGEVMNEQILEDCVLVDVPRRDVHDFGNAFVIDREQKPRTIYELSPLVRAVREQLLKLKFTARVFVPTELRDKIEIEVEEGELEHWLEQAVAETTAKEDRELV